MHASFFSMLHVFFLNMSWSCDQNLPYPEPLFLFCWRRQNFVRAFLMICLLFSQMLLRWSSEVFFCFFFWFFFCVNRSRLMNHFVLSDRNLIFIKITLLYTSLTLYTSLNRLMFMGSHSSVRSASNLQSRGSGFDPWSVGACCKHEIVILHG